MAIKLTAHKPFPVQSGRYQQVKDDWHHEGTSENPLSTHKRVVEKKPTWIEGPSKIGTYRVSEDKSLLNHYFVNEVQSVTRGGGRAAMEHLTAAADRHGVSLSLVAEPLKPQGEGVKMTRAKLRSWYQQHGFRPSKGDLMTRTPARMEKSMQTANPFARLSDRLEKSWFMERRVRFGSAKNPVNEGRTTTTMMADGKARKITTGPVKASRVPDEKKDKLKKEVVTAAPSDFTTNRAGDPMLSPSAEFVSSQLSRGKLKTKDTDTVKHTFRRDGSVDAIRLFAKSLLAHLNRLQAQAHV